MTRKQKKMRLRILLTIVLMAGITLLCRAVPLSGWARLAVYMVPYFLIGYDVLRKAVLGICNRQVFDENFLMAVATVGSVLLGEYAESVAVMLFYQIGELFQSYAVGKSRRNINELMDIRPDYANIADEQGRLQQVDPEEVAVGTVIVVQPGERVPIDGVVEEGTSQLNTSALTGESLPREVGPGDEAVSGCINMSGLLHIRTTRAFGQSTVSQILDLVENSSLKKARTENFITRFARYYTPAVCYGALALAVLPSLLRLVMGMDPLWGSWVYRALTFLVISCPCALVIAIPLSFFGGIGGASACGILVKGANYLEILADTRTVVFDKTGTLTRGVFEVTEVCPADGGSDPDTLLYRTAQAESFSNHPISRSLKAACRRPLDPNEVTEVQEEAGFGVTARVGECRIAAGNARLMHQLNVSFEEVSLPGTVVYVAEDGRYAGYILIADRVKPTAAQAIASLKARGVRTVMLTGDAEQVAQAVGSQLGVDRVYSELLPADKVEWVEKLLQENTGKGRLAFVGDGINDAPVLSRADIGIAMGALGSDAAIEAADIVLMEDDPAKIDLAMKISRRTLNIVWQNIVFALTIKAACLVLGALGIANMWVAIFADVGVMVLAVLNATRALYTKKLR